jgi:ABC-type multidrug transport system fused ATPase/permease subunit
LPYAAATIAHNIRLAYFRSVLRSELSEFDKKMSGAIVIDINEKVHNIEKALSIKMAELMSASAQFFLGMVFAFYYCWQLTLVVMALLPLMVFATSCMYKSGFGQEQMLGKQAYEYAANLANEAVSAMRTVSSFSGEVAMSKRYNSKLGASQKAATKAGWKMAFGSSLVDFAFFAMMGAGLFFGGYFALDSRKVALEKYPAPYDLHWEHFDKTNFTNPYYMNHMASELGDFCRFPTNNSLAYIQCMCNIDWSAIKGDTAFASPNCGCQYRGDDFIKGKRRVVVCRGGLLFVREDCFLLGRIACQGLLLLLL